MILVIPDVHGRDFWREPCKDIEKYSQVIFLGDYLDPYGFDNITLAEALTGFTDIIALAEAHPDKVTLLLGNHDLHYMTSEAGMSSRHSYWMADHASPIFNEKRPLFRLACEVGDTLFTHAGCLQGWLDEVAERRSELNLTMNAASLNSLLDVNERLRVLAMVSQSRGGWNRHGSCVWADVGEHLDVASPRPQVFGHTVQAARNPITDKVEYRREVVRPEQRWMMLDCGHAFELDENDPFTYTRLPNPQIDKEQ